jgi:hypothetical protein
VQQPDAFKVLAGRIICFVAPSELQAVHLVEDLGEGDHANQIPPPQRFEDPVKAPGENHEALLQGQPHQLGC